MAAREFAKVRPALLRWARESAALSPEGAAKKIGIKPERLMAWERDELRPTVKQLRKAAHVYRRPLAAFFLAAPPREPEPLRDFRRLYGEDPPPLSSDLALEMRRARWRRAVALRLLDELGAEPPRFHIRATLDDDAEELAEALRQWLGIELATQSAWRGPYDALNGWTAILEAHGVLVFQSGDVALDEMRGFSLGEPELPAIVVNAKDSPRARVFTLLHECTHLVLQEGGICDPARVRTQGRSVEERVEVFCNRVAGATLVPARALLADPRVANVRQPEPWDDDTIAALAERFAASREVVLRRLLILGRTTEAFYEAKRREFREAYEERVARARERPGFAPPWRLAVRNNGRRYTSLVLEAFEREQITPADVSDYLGVRLKHLEAITDAVQTPVEV